ncbi:hypothetical protein CR513_00944, partial [Mucuna pruriens]
MNKIRNGHDRATWIQPSVQKILDEHWASTDFQNKRSTAKANQAIDKGASAYCGGSISTIAHYEKNEKTKKLKSGEWVNDKTCELVVNSIFYLFKHYFKLKYEQRGQEVQKSTTEEATSANDSNFVLINDNDIYLEVVGGKNEKAGNVYGLGKLTNKFMRSTRIPTNLIDMPMVQQMEEICKTIHKLNNELVEEKLRRSHLRRKGCNCRTIIRSKVNRFDNKINKCNLFYNTCS